MRSIKAKSHQTSGLEIEYLLQKSSQRNFQLATEEGILIQMERMTSWDKLMTSCPFVENSSNV